MNIIIAGGGNVGINLTKVLSKERHKITLIERDVEIAKQIAFDTDALVIKGDASNMVTLEESGIEKCDAIVAATQDDKTNMMICEIARSVGVPRIVARVNDPGNEELFVKLGIHSIIPVTQLAVTSISNVLLGAGERIVAQISDGKAQILELVIPQSSSLRGSSGTRINGALLGSVYRNGTVIIADKDTKLEAGDVALFITKTETIPRLIQLVKGE
ncbi:MAG: NAD-binding protein [archaeon]